MIGPFTERLSVLSVCRRGLSLLVGQCFGVFGHVPFASVVRTDVLRRGQAFATKGHVVKQLSR